MHFESILDKIGGFGTYQRILCFLFIPLTTGFVGLVYYSQLIILASPPYICNKNKGNVEGGQNFMQLLNSSDYSDEIKKPYMCHYHDPNMTWPENVTSVTQLDPPTMTCDGGWTYDYDAMFSTYTSEHSWVCNDAWRPYLVITLFWAGNTVGAWLWGIVSDMYGRRVAIVGCMVVYGTAGTASVFVHNFYAFAILRFITGSSHHTVAHLPFVLVVEYCVESRRVIPLLCGMASYTIASIITPALAWLIWSWYPIALIPALLTLTLPISARWIPESASWLLTRGRIEEAKEQLSKVARVNGYKLPDDVMTKLLTKEDDVDEGTKDEDMEKNIEKDDILGVENDKGKDESHSGQSIIHALKYPGLRRNIILVLFILMLAFLCFYGHCQNTANLGPNILLSYLLGSLVEVPSWCVPFIINKWGRRIPLIVLFLISSSAGFLHAAIPQNVGWLVLTAGLIGRASITGAYYISLQYCPEIFPTVVRGQGVALAETLGGVAIFISPLIVYLGEYERTMPLIIFGGLSILAGAATILLPETLGAALPHTLTQAETFARREAPTCCRSKSSDSNVNEGEDVKLDVKV